MTWGAEAYVIKSSDLTELKQKVREVLDKRKKRRNLIPQTGQHYREKSRSRRLLEDQTSEIIGESGSSARNAA
jgi:DNA-binding NarL/FixJ family response regulator